MKQLKDICDSLGITTSNSAYKVILE